MRGPSILTALLLLTACGGDGGAQGAAAAAASAQEPAKVGYDLRRLRPTSDEPLAKTFERMHAQAKAEGKQVAMLFSAEWCERCRRLELELGNLHPEGDIAHVRILELVEEDWEQALRMNEFELLRQRWDATKGTYPLFVVVDAEARKVEEMKEAVDRLEQAGQEATVATWFRGLRQS
jgi:thiol-disulfide isomerase/thioredoxin